MGRNHLISNDQVMGFLKETFHLTGNNVLDLLNIIQLFQELQFLFIILICYNILFTRINLVKLEGFLIRFLPAVIVRLYIRSLSVYQKSSLIFLICFIILLSICNFYSIYYLGFFIDNLDSIIDFYFKNK